MDESPEQTISREMKEELGLWLDQSQLKYLWRQHDWEVVSHVFAYSVSNELDGVQLLEGQRLEFVRLSDLKYRNVVPWHRDILERYERQKPL